MHPPNIHEIERVLLLRQALDILEASEDVQRSLYPDDLDPATEMKTLFRDAWHGVRRVFTPILQARSFLLPRRMLPVDQPVPNRTYFPSIFMTILYLLTIYLYHGINKYISWILVQVFIYLF